MRRTHENFRVRWEIDISARSAEAAALKALETQRDPDSEALVFTVKGGSGKRYKVDLTSSEEKIRRVALSIKKAVDNDTPCDGEYFGTLLNLAQELADLVLSEEG